MEVFCLRCLADGQVNGHIMDKRRSIVIIKKEFQNTLDLQLN